MLRAASKEEPQRKKVARTYYNLLAGNSVSSYAQSLLGGSPKQNKSRLSFPIDLYNNDDLVVLDH